MRRLITTLLASSVVATLGCDTPSAPSGSAIDMKSMSRGLQSSAEASPGSCALQTASDRFAHPVFPWMRTSETVYLASGTVHIAAGNGTVDDGFAAPCYLSGSWEVEVTGRIASGGLNYVFPKIHGQFSNGEWFIATSLPDGAHGWLLMVCNPESWLPEDVVPGHTSPEICSDNRWNPAGPASVAEGEFMSLKVAADATHLRLFAKHAGTNGYVLAHAIPYASTGLSVRRVGVSQPWDADAEVTDLNVNR